MPVINRFVIKICPMKIKIRVKFAIRSGISKIYGFFWVHGNKNLHQRKQTGKYSFMRIFFNLVICLAYRYATLFQFDMNNRHTVYKQHYIAAAFIKHWRFGIKFRLFYDLITALPGCNFAAVINFKRYLFAKVQSIIRIIALNHYAATVNKTIKH